MTYSIGECARIVQVTTSTLRFYEKEGLLTPSRDIHNGRTYTDADIGWIKFLLHLKSSGMSITELKQYTDWRAKGDETIQDRKMMLEQKKSSVEQEMKDLQKNLDILKRKIEFYEDRLNGHHYEFVL